MTTEESNLEVVPRGTLFRIRSSRGRTPDVLDSLFTTVYEAQQAIDKYNLPPAPKAIKTKQNGYLVRPKVKFKTVGRPTISPYTKRLNQLQEGVQ